ncbi:MAG TPA: LacI family DNA-binding transcriptional regulator [Bryobacteraceae bacterium]
MPNKPTPKPPTPQKTIPKKTTPTMRDVARLANVSVATVSAVVNGSAVVSAQRAARVKKAMETLDYHADQIARGLKTGRTRVVGVVIPDITNPFYPEVILGAEEVAGLARYSVILCNANEDTAQEERQLNALFSHRVDGVLIACSNPAVAVDRLLHRRFPIVCFDRIPEGFRGDAAATDNFAGGYEATRHLIELGHRRIAILAGRTELSTHSGRLEGFRKAMQEAQLPVLDEYCRTGGMQAETGYRFGRALVRLATPPTAVFCSNNKVLLGFMRALAEAGVECPADISVVGFDDFTWTENFHPPLTVVYQPARELGRQAMHLLLSRIESGAAAAECQRVQLRPELHVRQSTARVEEAGRPARIAAPGYERGF